MFCTLTLETVGDMCSFWECYTINDIKHRLLIAEFLIPLFYFFASLISYRGTIFFFTDSTANKKTNVTHLLKN